MKSIILALVCTCILFSLSGDTSPTANRRIVVFVGSDASGAATSVFRRLLIEARRYRIEERFRVEFVNLPLPLQPKQSLVETVNAANELAPLLAIALSHDVALAYAANNQRGKARTLIFATRESPDAVLASARKNGVSATGTRSLGLDDDERRASLLFEWLPHTSHVGILWDGRELSSLEAASNSVKKISDARISVYRAINSTEIHRAFSSATREGVGAMLIGDNDSAAVNSKDIVLAAMLANMPVVSGESRLCLGLPGICYYSATGSHYERWIEATVQILTGVSADEIPVGIADQAMLLCNAASAAEIGKPLPDAIIARADYAYGKIDIQRLDRRSSQ